MPGLLRRLYEAFGGSAEANRTPSTASLNVVEVAPYRRSDTVAGSGKASELITEGYIGNIVVKACIQEFADNFPLHALKAVDRNGADLAEDHPALLWIRSPSPAGSEVSARELFRRWIVDHKATGAGYLRTVPNFSGGVAGLRHIPSVNMTANKGARLGDIDSYTFKVDSFSEPIPAAEVLALRSYNPLDPAGTLSPVMAVSRFVDIDNEAAAYLHGFFQHGAQPAGLLFIKRRQTSDAERKNLQDRWKEKYGRGNWEDIAVLDEDASFQELGSRPAKLQLDHIWSNTEARICAAFQIPPVVVQMKVGWTMAHYANYREARVSEWEETLLPYYEEILGIFNAKIVAKIVTDGAKIMIDRGKIEVLQEAETAQLDRAVKRWDAGISTFDETRKACGLEEVGGEKGETYKGEAVVEEPIPPPGATVEDKEEDAEEDEDAADAEEDAEEDEDAEDAEEGDDVGPAKKKATKARYAKVRRVNGGIEIDITPKTARLLRGSTLEA